MTRSGPKFGSTLESRTLIFGSKWLQGGARLQKSMLKRWIRGWIQLRLRVQGARIPEKTVMKNKEEEERKGRKLLEKRLDENVARRIIWRRRRRNHCWRSSGLRLSSSHHHQFL